MPSLKELRNRIASVQATQKITRAMQMVAAAKLRRAQERVEQSRPYTERMASVIANLSASMSAQEGGLPMLVGTGSDQRHLFVVATADRGLAGAFSSSIARAARDKAQILQRDGKEVKFLFLGKKGFDVLKRLYESQTVEVFEVGTSGPTFADAELMSAKIAELFDAGEFDVATLFFGKFVSVITQDPTQIQMIPAAVEGGDGETLDLGGAAYDYEPDESEILKELLPRYVTTQVFGALLENAASEQGARMTAMDNATRNAGEMIDSLTLTYNRSRQAQITKELIEIISGAEAI